MKCNTAVRSTDFGNMQQFNPNEYWYDWYDTRQDLKKQYAV